MSDDLVGTDLAGRYRVESRVGDAMLGRVYAARGVEDGRLYHVKVPHAAVTRSAEKTERFRREFEALRNIQHPHVVTLVDADVHDGVAFLVLEYLAATPLQVAMERDRMSPQRVAGIVAQVASALAAAHAVGVVHRNLSPQTIHLLDNAFDKDFVKVTDFGLSRFVEDDTTSMPALTQAGARIGNVLYMAPEYIENDEVGPKGDMYALGALTYHLLTGNPPYQGKAADVLTRHVTEEPPKPSTSNPRLPSWCDTLVARLMARKPEQRPTADQVVAALEQEFGSLRAPKLLGIDEEGQVVRKSRTPVYFAIAGTVVLGLGVALFGMAGIVVSGVLLVTRGPDWVLGPSLDLAPAPDARMVAAPEVPAPGVPAKEVPEPTPAPVPENGANKPVLSPSGPSPAPIPAPAPSAEVPPRLAEKAILRIRASKRALVHLDDVPIGYTPLDWEVDEGDHTVAALLPGHAETRQAREIKAAAATPTTVEFRF